MEGGANGARLGEEGSVRARDEIERDDSLDALEATLDERLHGAASDGDFDTVFDLEIFSDRRLTQCESAGDSPFEALKRLSAVVRKAAPVIEAAAKQEEQRKLIMKAEAWTREIMITRRGLTHASWPLRVWKKCGILTSPRRNRIRSFGKMFEGGPTSIPVDSTMVTRTSFATR